MIDQRTAPPSAEPCSTVETTPHKTTRTIIADKITGLKLSELTTHNKTANSKSIKTTLFTYLQTTSEAIIKIQTYQTTIAPETDPSE